MPKNRRGMGKGGSSMPRRGGGRELLSNDGCKKGPLEAPSACNVEPERVRSVHRVWPPHNVTNRGFETILEQMSVLGIKVENPQKGKAWGGVILTPHLLL